MPSSGTSARGARVNHEGSDSSPSGLPAKKKGLPPKPPKRKGNGGKPPSATPPAPRKSGRVPNLDQPVDLSAVKMSGGAKALLGGECDRKLAATFGF